MVLKTKSPKKFYQKSSQKVGCAAKFLAEMGLLGSQKVDAVQFCVKVLKKLTTGSKIHDSLLVLRFGSQKWYTFGFSNTGSQKVDFWFSKNIIPLVLSDGTNSGQAMLNSKLNYFVEEDSLKTGSIIKLKEKILTNTAQGTR